jgi:uncharacterized protein YfaS (alpha-2-macroglobulin family)
MSRLAEIANDNMADAGALAFAGMSYLNLKKPGEAAAAGAKIRNLLRSTTRGVDLTDPREGGSFYYTYYGNKLEQLALVLEFFVRQYPGDQINGRILYSLLEQKRSGGYWDSTAITVRILSAVDALIRAENLASVNVTGTISLSGQELFKDSYKGLGAKPSGKRFDFKEAPLASLKRDSALPLVIGRSGQGTLYYTASLTYAIPSELQSFRDEGLGIFVSISEAGSGKEINGGGLESGKTYRARVRLSSGRDRTYVALRVPVPSGAEILDSAFVTTASYQSTEKTDSEKGREWAARLSNRIILDNEIQFFWDNFSKGESTIEFLFRTSRRGVFPTPPAQAECMYEPEIFGRSPGLLYTIE